MQKLTSRILPVDKARKVIEQRNEFPRLTLNQDMAMDVDKIAIGAFSPLEGFMTQNDYVSVMRNKTMENGEVWTLPITLHVEDSIANNFKTGEQVLLEDENGKAIALLNLEEKYRHDKEVEAKNIFGTLDLKHPGVAHTFEQSNTILAGKVWLVQRHLSRFKEYELTPEETRSIFQKNKWKTVVAFHTRNPPHRAHEFLQKCALELVDGLFIQPVIGRKKPDDFPPEAIVAGYEVLIKHFYPKDRVLFTVLSTYSRYAGPREAVFTALVRRNYGATHFIVGRDHTGVGNFYDRYASHRIFDELGDIGITALRFNGPFFCSRCSGIATDKTCPHDEQTEVSGTKIRSMIYSGNYPPDGVMRKEVAEAIVKALGI